MQKKSFFFFISEYKGLALALCTFRSKKFDEVKVTKKGTFHKTIL